MSEAGPRLLVVGGPNGAGKTTLARAIAMKERLPYLGADDLAQAMRPDDPAAARIAAGRAFRRQLDRSLAQRDSLVIESTLSGLSLRGHLLRARALGYRIAIVLTYLDSADLCIRRVAQRVAAGGHDVPEADIRRRYRRSLLHFVNSYRLLADNWTVMFNGEGGFETVAIGQGRRVQVLINDARWAPLAALDGQGDADDRP